MTDHQVPLGPSHCEDAVAGFATPPESKSRSVSHVCLFSPVDKGKVNVPITLPAEYSVRVVDAASLAASSITKNGWVAGWAPAKSDKSPCAHVKYLTSSSKVADRELSDQEKAFVLAYLGEARQHKKLAATLAGYSARSAHVAATRLLQRPRIKQALSKKRLELERDLAISVDRVAQELARVGFSDVRRLFNGDGRLKAIEDLDDITAASIASVKLTRERTTTSNGGDITTVVEEAIIEVKLRPKVEALIALARTLGMFGDKVKVSGRLTLEQLVGGSMKPETAA